MAYERGSYPQAVSETRLIPQRAGNLRDARLGLPTLVNAWTRG
jgi:hypothetical protein